MAVVVVVIVIVATSRSHSARTIINIKIIPDCNVKTHEKHRSCRHTALGLWPRRRRWRRRRRCCPLSSYSSFASSRPTLLRLLASQPPSIYP